MTEDLSPKEKEDWFNNICAEKSDVTAKEHYDARMEKAFLKQFRKDEPKVIMRVVPKLPEESMAA